MYFYEGRTVRGVGWMSWGLLTQLAATLLGAASTIIILVALGSVLTFSPATWAAFAAAIAVICGLAVVEIAALVLYIVGLHSMYAGRHEYGVIQDRNMDRALVFVILVVVFAAIQAVSPVAIAFGGIIGGTPTDLATSAVVVAAQTATALLAGLALWSAVIVFADRGQRTRLIVGVCLGVAGVFAGAVILLAGSFTGGTAGSPLEVIVASAVAGSGTSAISLLVFFLVYREIRRKLETGAIAPAVPMFPPVWPYYPPVLYPPPQAPAGPATPPTSAPPKP